MYSHELKIKRLTLGAESRIIKQQEKRLFRKARKARASQKVNAGNAFSRKAELLNFHRRVAVKRQARACHLAHTYLRGQTYRTAERDPRSLPSDLLIVEIAKNVRRFWTRPTSAEQLKNEDKLIRLWIEEGHAKPLWAQPPELTAAE